MTTAPENFQVDGLAPKRVQAVSSQAELSAALGEAHSANEAVIPWGGGTRMHVGNVPGGYDVALDLSALASNIEHEPGDLTLVADAGVTIGHLNSLLGEQGQRLPFDVAEPDRATLGGSVASNAPGRMRSSMGGIRDWIIGISVVLADGTATKSGGRVVKNVQGYDLHRLHTGAYGTLGVISQVGLKVVPIPRKTSAVAAWFNTVEDAGDFVLQVINGPAMPETLTLFSGDGLSGILESLGQQDATGVGAVVMAGVPGGDRAVERLENDLTGLAGATGASGYEVTQSSGDIGHGKDHSPQDAEIRVTLKPTDAIKLVSSVIGTSGEGTIGAELQAGFGAVAFSVKDANRNIIDRVIGEASRFGGRAVVERCPLVIKTELDVFGPAGLDMAVMKAIKNQFDPGRTLNPGRFAGRI